MENEEPAVIAPLLDCYFFSEVLAVKEFYSPVQVLPGINKEAS